MTTVAIIGTGNVGAALGERLATSGLSVRFGAREGTDAAPLLERAGANASVHAPVEAVKGAGLVFLAVPAKAAVEAVRAADAGASVLVDCTNPVRWDQGPVWDPPAEGSVAQALAAAFPEARVVKSFNTFGAEFHANPTIDAAHAIDVFMAGDDPAAKAAVAAIAERAGFTPVDAGPLRNASVVENLAVLWIHLALAGGQGRDVAFKLLRRSA